MNSTSTAPSKFKCLTKEERQFYREHIIKCEKSGISQRKYCEQNKLNLNTFTYQRQQYLKSNPVSKQHKFIPVKLDSVKDKCGNQNTNNIVFRLANGCALELPLETPVEKIGDLLLRVRQLP